MKVMIGLGGNLGNPPGAFSAALESLGAGITVLRTSPLYRSSPVGPPQPEYWNMAALLAVEIPLLVVLDRCQELERRAGRRRGREERWGPRPLDLDLLMADGVVHLGPRLRLPHPRFHLRAFAMRPAADLAPAWVHPHLGRSLRELASGLATAKTGSVRAAVSPSSRPDQSSGEDVNL